MNHTDSLYLQLVWWTLVAVFAVYMILRIRKNDRISDFNRGVADAKHFIASGVSVEALRSYSDLMRKRNRYGQYEAGVDSILKEFP